MDDTDCPVPCTIPSVFSPPLESTLLLPRVKAEEPTTWTRELKILGRFVCPAAIANLLQYSLSMSSMLIISPRGKIELGAVSVATTTANITGFFVLQGLATALDTLCGQAYGSGNQLLARVYVQKMIVALAAVGVPISLFWLNAGHIFSSVLPDTTVSQLAGLYMNILICAIPGFLVFEAGKRILMSQGAFSPVMLLLCAGACTNVFVGWLLVWRYEFGFIGAPIAVAATWTLTPLYLLLYLRISGRGGIWSDTLFNALKGWGPMLRLAIPGLVMMEAEFLAFEILVVASAQFSTEHLAAQTIMALLNGCFWQIPFSISVAGSTLVAQHIGAKSTFSARMAARVMFGAALASAATNSAFFFIFRMSLPTILTNDPVVLLLTAKSLPVVALMQLFDGLAACTSGVLRGIGRPSFGGWVNLLCYYTIALPLSFWTAFVLKWELNGLWFGVTVALVMVTVAEAVYITSVSWDDCIQDAEQRNAA